MSMNLAGAIPPLQLNENSNDITKPVAKGAVIGAGVGAVGQAALSYGMLGKCPTKDEFIRKGISSVQHFGKGQSKEVVDGAVEAFKNSADSLYKKTCDTYKSAKKAIPATAAKTAGIVAVIGAGIGLIVGLVKKSKAEEQTQQQ